MAHKNEYEYLRRFLEKSPIDTWPEPLKNARVLEIGARHYGHGLDYRPLFPGMTWLGIDQQAGGNVDVVCDMADPRELHGESFGAILCCSVLEHSTRPWLVAEQIERHLLPEGLLYVTTPWIWRWHPYPADYWRFSAQGIRQLFPQIEWKRMAYATQAPGEFLRVEKTYDEEPWRTIYPGGRVNLISMMVCMIGRKR